MIHPRGRLALGGGALHPSLADGRGFRQESPQGEVRKFDPWEWEPDSDDESESLPTDAECSEHGSEEEDEEVGEAGAP